MSQTQNNSQNPRATAIFVHSLFRSGSTFFFNALKRADLYHVYHEPMHEVIASLPSLWSELGGRSAQLKRTLRHDFLAGGYFDEYAHLLPVIKKTFSAKLSFDLFFMGEADSSPELKSYIDALISGASRAPVLQCTRTIGRINWLKANYHSKHIFLLRNPWDQWYSYKVDNYISTTPRVIYSQSNLPEVLKEVMASRGLSPLLGDETQAMLGFGYSHPIPPDADYCLFFGLWVYAFIIGRRDCDVSIDMDAVSSSVNYRDRILKDLEAIGLKSIDLSDAHLHRTVFTEREKSFYQLVEEQVLEIFRQQGWDVVAINSVREYLRQQRNVAFVSERSERGGGSLEDAARMREILLSNGQHAATATANLNQAVTERDGQIANLNQAVAERDGQIANLNQAVAERDRQIANLNQVVTERDGQIANLNQAVAERDGQIANLNQVVTERDNVLRPVKSSHSWRATAPLRALSMLIKNKSAAIERSDIQNASAPGAEAFFSICSKNFLAHARVLYNSIRAHYPNARFFVVLCDRVDGFFEPAQEPFEFVYLDELALPNLNDMAERYNITEFNTAVKPFAFTYLMNKHGFNSVIYLDPDLLFVDKMQELDQMLAEGAEAVLTPHILQPAEHDEVHDGKMLLFGIYNLGFLALRNTPSVRAFLSWWGRRLERDCVIRLDQGIFVDQKWADLLPAFVSGTRVIHHPGYNVAYWNLPQRKITRKDNRWFANDQPLRFVHFSGNKIDDLNTFSRHSQQVTIESIGDLRYLLNYYREQVYSQGHQFYRKLPYAYSWDGHSGVNLHTPKSLDMAAPESNTEFVPLCNKSTVQLVKEKNRMLSRINVMRRSVPLARRLSGGWLSLAKRAWGAYRRNGWGYVKAKIVELSSYQSPPTVAPTTKTFAAAPDSEGRRKLLYLDWAIPKPDQDAASVTAMLLMRIFDSLGYAVTFVPCGLKYEQGYYEALVAAGVDVVCYPRIESVENWLGENAADFDICVLARGPVVWPYLKTIKKCAPNLHLIFNTVDLHYLRELRQAELAGDEKARHAAIDTRNKEFDLISQCDLTIVLSSEELYVIREIYPQASLAVLPVVFEEMPGAVKPFEERRDILFIGSFPHLPNIDAVVYFAEEIFPLIQKRIPDICFKVIGSNPPENICNLAKNPGIQVLGFVKDLAPLFEEIRLTVAPLRYGAGIKGKIGSSLCYGVPCIATSIAVEGMGLVDGDNVLVGDAPEEIANAVCRAYLDVDLWKKISAQGHQFAVDNYSVSVIRQQVDNILWAVEEGWKPIESGVEIDGWQSFQKHRARLGDEYEKRVLREQELLPTDDSESFFTHGFCCVCGRETKFLTSFMYSTGPTPDGRKMPNWREHMQCGHCGLVNRMRAALNALHTLAPPTIDSRIYVTEHLTSTYKWLRARYQHLQGSEYFGQNYEPGTTVDGVQHEDVMNLSFADSSFDRLLSFDVLEHVPDPAKAFREIYRVLDTGGVFLFSVPFSSSSQADIVRASLRPDGTIEHHWPAEYHGNPVDPEGGALCFRYFGWELLDQLRAIGFSRVRILAYWSEKQGYLGKEQYLFIAEKK